MKVLEQPTEVREPEARAPLPRKRRRTHRGATVQSAFLAVCSVAFLLLLLLPLYAIFWQSLPHGRFFSALRLPLVRDALRLSLVTTAIALGATVLLGTPVAYLLARYRFPGHNLLDSIIDLPMV